MPESKSRKQAEAKKKYGRKSRAAKAQAKNSRAALAENRGWVVPAFITAGLLGIMWLVVWYITAATGVMIPFMSDLGNWNMLIGMGLIGVAFTLSTLWK